MNGKVVFEMLEKMTDEERGRCVFPGFFDPSDYNVEIMYWVNNKATDKDEAKMVMNTPKNVVAELMQKVVRHHRDEWLNYENSLFSDLMGKVIEAAKASKK